MHIIYYTQYMYQTDCFFHMEFVSPTCIDSLSLSLSLAHSHTHTHLSIPPVGLVCHYHTSNCVGVGKDCLNIQYCDEGSESAAACTAVVTFAGEFNIQVSVYCLFHTYLYPSPPHALIHAHIHTHTLTHGCYCAHSFALHAAPVMYPAH